MAEDKNKKLDIESRKKRAYELHAQVMLGAKKIFSGWIEIGIALKEINELRYYKELGFSSFKNYIETEFHKSESTAYRYIEGVKKIPGRILANLQVSNSEIPALFKVLALPDDRGFIDSLTEGDLRELARMSDPEFATASTEAKKDPAGWQARYQKKYRENQVLQEQLATLKAESKSAYKQLDDAQREIATLKIGESNEKILKITQERDNALAKIQDIGNRLHELEAKELKGEQAFAAIREHMGEIITHIMELVRIKLEPEFLPYMWSEYLMIKTLISGQVAYILDKMEVNPEQGEGWLYTLAKTIDPSLMDRPFTKEEYQKLKAEGKLPLQVFPKFDKKDADKEAEPEPEPESASGAAADA